MKRVFTILTLTVFAGLLLVAGGCGVLSKNPFYTDDTVVVEPIMSREWHRVESDGKRSDDFFKVEGQGKQSAVSSWSKEKGWDRSEKPAITLFKVEDHFFIDFDFPPTKDSDDDYISTHRFHSACKVMLNGRKLLLIDPDPGPDFIRKNPELVKHDLCGKIPNPGEADERCFILDDTAKNQQAFLLHALSEISHVSNMTFDGGPIEVTEGNGIASKHQRSYDYWWLVGIYSKNLGAWLSASGSPDDTKLDQFQSAAKAIGDLSTLGVDEDIAVASTEFCASIQACVDVAGKSPGTLELLLTSPAAIETGLTPEQQAAHQRMRNSVSQFKKLAKVLTARYGMEYDGITIPGRPAGTDNGKGGEVGAPPAAAPPAPAATVSVPNSPSTTRSERTRKFYASFKAALGRVAKTSQLDVLGQQQAWASLASDIRQLPTDGVDGDIAELAKDWADFGADYSAAIGSMASSRQGDAQTLLLQGIQAAGLETRKNKLLDRSARILSQLK